MSSGALAWINYIHNSSKKIIEEKWNNFYLTLAISAFSSCIGVLGSQYIMPSSSINIGLFFSIFSIIVGSIILLRTLKGKKSNDRICNLSNLEMFGLVILSLLGGVITSWISIGIGEILLIYFILLKFRLDISVAIAVCVSAISVLVALPYHIFSESINLNVLVYAALGAIIGGAIARSLAIRLGAYKLKIAASTWIILSSLPHFII